MKTIIAGSRNLEISYDELIDCINTAAEEINITEVLCGFSGVVDMAGKAWAEKNMLKVSIYPADWDTYNKAAGPIRNQKMVNNAEALLLIWDGKSRGSLDVLTKAKKKELQILEVQIGNNKITINGKK